MRITLRLILSLVCAVTLAVLAFTLYQVWQERERLEDDLDRRAWLRAEELATEVAAAVRAPDRPALTSILERGRRREHLAGAAVYAAGGEPLAATAPLADRLPPLLPIVQDAVRTGAPANGTEAVAGNPLRVHVLPLRENEAVVGILAVFHDASYIEHHVAEVWRRNFVRLLVHAFLIALVTLLVVRWTILRPMGRLAGWIRDLRLGKAEGPAPTAPAGDLFRPLAEEVSSLARSFQAARRAAEEEARLRERAESVWTADRLKEHCRRRLEGRPLIVVSNREPCMHLREGKTLRWIVPASGLVTALEPVLRACGGTWVAHGGGSGDRETADARGVLRVPPDDPQYTLRRVWLTPEEEGGYYYGFSNEGLWPLCHIAHARPLFRPDDWRDYRTVNERFSEVVLDEIRDAAEPCILIQDYHFALLPRLIKDRRPDARVAVFWHIPWPNPEAFGICPWQRDILGGMLAADLIGFHTQFHCNNFLETIDRALESRIDWERFAVNRGEHVTHVKPFPISVAFTGRDETPGPPPGERDRGAVAARLGFAPRFLGVGVDRMDYTKGILERFRAIERFLDKHPRYAGAFTFVQIGAPSRTRIPRYQDLGREVEAEARRINDRFKGTAWRPIVLMNRHHGHDEIAPFYRAADVCLVTSLHDGMNLVAKEYIAARSDERGALILSQFAGASRDLRDALIVNPYDVDQTADAVRYALEMEPAEQAARMARLRVAVRDRNVYWWAAELIGELARIRIDGPRAAAPPSPSLPVAPAPASDKASDDAAG